jgi:exopolysaccharide biosynthesis polyprenyl glycosylphosphotransferase
VRITAVIELSGTARQSTLTTSPPESSAGDRLRSRDFAKEAHGRWWRDAFRRRLLAGSDVLSGLIALLVVVVPATDSPWALAFLPLWPLLAKIFGLYDRDHRALRHLTADEVPTLLAWQALLATIVTLLLTLTPHGDMDAVRIAVLFLVSASAATTLRALCRWGWWRWTPPEQVSLLGEGEAFESVRRKFFIFREMHLQLATECRLEELGDAGDERSERLLELLGPVDRVVFAAEGVERELIGELKALCRRRAIKLSVVSPFRGAALPSEPPPRLADLPILEYNTWDPSRSTLILKRLFDFSAAAIGLLLAAPLLAVMAIAIKLDSRGPVLFSQVRAGLFGRPFRMYKLRTMTEDAEAHLESLVDLNTLDEPAFKLRDDPRVTRAGRILRRFSLDELPQLINVLVGEMSIVGPRPEQVEVVERYTDAERVRLSVKPGVTGPMQVLGRGELTFSERLAVEIQYIENPSLGQDLRILIHTLPAVVRGTGAF